MSRTIEKILGFIGGAMDLLFAAVVAIILLIINFGIGVFGNFNTDIAIVTNVMYIITNFFWIPVITTLVSFTLAMMAVFRANRNPRSAGALFIASAAISSWLLFTGIAFQSVLYAIAGIMCFVRKDEGDRPIQTS